LGRFETLPAAHWREHVEANRDDPGYKLTISAPTNAADLFAANQNRALSIDEVTRHTFDLGAQAPNRAQRLSATRAAHRVIRRTREMDEARGPLLDEAEQRICAALGREHNNTIEEYAEYSALRKADPAWRKAKRLFEAAYRIGFKSRFGIEKHGQYVYVNTEYWRAITVGKGRGAKLWFHAPDVPIQVWAVKLDRGDVH
jgi:hypothetical protein